jgi:GLPGLI family protein
MKMMGGGPGMENVVYTDLRTERVTANKQVYEQKFLVQDSMRRIDWKEKDELRTIAGFKCRKAVGKICDSVYVVAFYAEDIPVAGGPEMFGGLPGMILELAIPRLHTTWVATKVEVVAPKATDFMIPEKGKKVNEKELFETVQTSFKSWGKMASRNVWWTVL